MAAVTISIEPEELASLRALAERDAAAGGRQADVAGTAAALLRRALAANLRERGLAGTAAPQAPRRLPAATAAPGGVAPASRPADRRRRYAAGVLAAGVAVLLLGGYALGWRWTGFRVNGQLWDWMSLLLLPVVVSTLPLWIGYARDISRARWVSALAAMAAFAVFAAAGYLVPLHWTGFRSQTLWAWFGLLLLPAALVIAPLLPKDARSLRPGQKWVVALLALAWAVTILGGYALGWKWTGYQGNTLWDWLRLLLLPLVVPTLLTPPLLRRVSGRGTQPPQQGSAAAPPAPRQTGLTAPAGVGGSKS